MHLSCKDSVCPPEEAVLFSERFQYLYQCLGLFVGLSVRGPDRHVGREELLSEMARYPGMDKDILLLLTSHGLLLESEGCFLLNESLFFGMTLWDLLVICEPWLLQPLREKYSGSVSRQEYEAFREFCCLQNLGQTYLMGETTGNPLWNDPGNSYSLSPAVNR